MAKKRHLPIKDKSRTFASFNHFAQFNMRFKLSLCGDEEFKEDFEIVFRDSSEKKNDFLNARIRKDLGKEGYEEFKNSPVFNQAYNLIWKELLMGLSKNGFYFTNKQEYLRHIFSSEREKKEAKEDEKK